MWRVRRVHERCVSASGAAWGRARPCGTEPAAPPSAAAPCGLQKERQAAAAALEAAARAQAEAARSSAKLAEVEEEMRGLLEAVERQKLASMSKMRQLASFLTDLT